MAIVTRDQIYNTQNVAIFRPLIAEFSLEPSKVIFTMNKEHKDGHISLYTLFVQFVVNDPTETEFAQEVFGDISYWFTIREFTSMRTYLDEWRFICDVLRKQQAFKTLIEQAKSKNSSSFQAAKYLIEEPWKAKNRVQKRKVAKSTQQAFEDSSVKEDLERISQSVN